MTTGEPEEIRFAGVAVCKGINFLCRDACWGTIPIENIAGHPPVIEELDDGCGFVVTSLRCIGNNVEVKSSVSVVFTNEEEEEKQQQVHQQHEQQQHQQRQQQPHQHQRQQQNQQHQHQHQPKEQHQQPQQQHHHHHQQQQQQQQQHQPHRGFRVIAKTTATFKQHSLRTARTGYVVLHGAEETKNKPVVINNIDDGSVFPYLITPHQPFTDIQSLSHAIHQHRASSNNNKNNNNNNNNITSNTNNTNNNNNNINLDSMNTGGDNVDDVDDDNNDGDDGDNGDGDDGEEDVNDVQVGRVCFTFTGNDGDVWEMEDQRQWLDHSFKTYYRPLRHKWPYLIPQNCVIEQSVLVDLLHLEQSVLSHVEPLVRSLTKSQAREEQQQQEKQEEVEQVQTISVGGATHAVVPRLGLNLGTGSRHTHSQQQHYHVVHDLISKAAFINATFDHKQPNALDNLKELAKLTRLREHRPCVLEIITHSYKNHGSCNDVNGGGSSSTTATSASTTTSSSSTLPLPSLTMQCDSELKSVRRALDNVGWWPTHIAVIAAEHTKSSATLDCYVPPKISASTASSNETSEVDSMPPIYPRLLCETARKVFPNAKIGTGATSSFTELNRRRPDENLIDFVIHSTCAIVHDAKDEAVMETVNAAKDVCETVSTLFSKSDHIISLACIGTRGNPFGGDLSNPQGFRKAMANVDPRHSALFGATYAVALVALMMELPAHKRPTAVALGEIYGDHSVIDESTTPATLLPIAHVLRCLFEAVDAHATVTKMSMGSVKAFSFVCHNNTTTNSTNDNNKSNSTTSSSSNNNNTTDKTTTENNNKHNSSNNDTTFSHNKFNNDYDDNNNTTTTVTRVIGCNTSAKQQKIAIDWSEMRSEMGRTTIEVMDCDSLSTPNPWRCVYDSVDHAHAHDHNRGRICDHDDNNSKQQLSHPANLGPYAVFRATFTKESLQS